MKLCPKWNIERHRIRSAPVKVMRCKNSTVGKREHDNWVDRSNHTGGDPWTTRTQELRTSQSRWQMCQSNAVLVARAITWSSLMATQLSWGKFCIIGTSHCKHPFQWPNNSIRHTRLNMRINLLATVRNCKQTITIDAYKTSGYSQVKLWNIQMKSLA